MSEEKIKVTSNLDQVNESYLDNFQYQDLEAVFKKLGVPNAFKGGKKKVDLIKEALKQISFLKAAQLKNVKKDEPKTLYEKAKDFMSGEKEVVKEVEVVKVVKEKVVGKPALKSDDELKEVLIKRLANLNANLKNNVPSHRSILIGKITDTEAALSKLA